MAIKSKDGAKATIQYTLVTNWNGEQVYRYFPVPQEVDMPFVPGFITREEAVAWWESSIQSEGKHESSN